MRRFLAVLVAAFMLAAGVAFAGDWMDTDGFVWATSGEYAWDNTVDTAPASTDTHFPSFPSFPQFPSFGGGK